MKHIPDTVRYARSNVKGEGRGNGPFFNITGDGQGGSGYEGQGLGSHVRGNYEELPWERNEGAM